MARAAAGSSRQAAGRAALGTGQDFLQFLRMGLRSGMVNSDFQFAGPSRGCRVWTPSRASGADPAAVEPRRIRVPEAQ